MTDGDMGQEEVLRNKINIIMLEGAKRVVGAVDHGINVLTYRAVEFAARKILFNKWKIAIGLSLAYGFLWPTDAANRTAEALNFLRGIAGFSPDYGYPTY